MAFSIDQYAKAFVRPPNAEERDIEAITAEIIRRKQNAGQEILAIGKCLIEAKAMLPHGEWLPWLTERAEFSERTAQNFMRLAREWSNPQTLTDLGASKALTLLALPPEERETFLAENNVVDMTSRELEKAIRERDEARKAAEAARADARSAEQIRAKMAEDMKVLKEIHVSAVSEADKAAAALLAAQKELEELRARPVEAAVEVDQRAVEKARAEAVAEMQAKVDRAERDRKKAEAALEEARRQLDERVNARRGRRDEARSAPEIGAILSQARVPLNQLHGMLLRAVSRKDMETAEMVREALLVLSDDARKRAE